MTISTRGCVHTERHGRALVVTIDRPEMRNAIDPAAAAGLAAAMDELDAEPDLLVGILTGAPGGGFCAGMDLRHAAATGERPIVDGRGFAGIVERPPTKPLIAAVDGAAAGGGFEIVLACDLVVASTAASFRLPEVRVGLVPGGGGLFRLPARVPHHVAMELVLTGIPLSAERALAFGLVNRLVEPGAVLAAALELAGEVAANAPVAVQVATEVVRASSADPGADWWSRQVPYIERVRATADATEGPRAFAEHRAPRWAGR